MVSSVRLRSTRIDAAALGHLLLTFALLAASILNSLGGETKRDVFMQITEKSAIIFLSISLVFVLLILAISIYAVFQRKKEELLLWGKWTLLVPLGFAPGLFLGAIVSDYFNETLGLFIPGFALGFAEWFVIRRYLKTPSHWILATVIGWASGIALTRYEGYPLRYFCGVILGSIQFLVIGQQYRRSAWWVVANVLGIAYMIFLGDAIFSLVPDFVNSLFDWRDWGGGGLITLIYSAITGITFVWLVQKDDRNTNVQDDMIKSVPNNHGVA